MEPSPIPAGGILFSGMDPTSRKRVDMGGRAGEMRFSGMEPTSRKRADTGGMIFSGSDPTSRKRADTGGVLFSGTDPTSRKRADPGGMIFSGTDPTSRKRADPGGMIFSGTDPTSRKRADMGGRAGGVLFSVDPTSRMWVDMSGHGSKEHDRHALLEQTRDRRLAVRRRNSFATEIQKSMKVKKAFEVARANYFFAFGVHNQQRVHSYSGDSELLCQLMLFLLNAYEDTHASEFSQVCNLLLHYLRADEAMFLDALECLLHPHSRESSLSSEFGNRLNFAKLSYLSRLNRSQWSVLRSSLGKYPDHTLAAENYSCEDNNRNSLCWVHTMNGFSGPETSSSSHKELKTTFVGIMDGSRKRAASNANAKSSSPDEDFGNDFLSSWKVPKSEDIVDFNVKSVLKSSKNFISDHINYLGLNGPFENISSCKMGMFDPNNAEEGASGPKNLSPSVQSFEILNASNSSILNAPSSTWPITDQSTVTSQVVIEFLNMYFEFPPDENCTIGSAVSIALCSKGIVGLDCFYSCQLEYFSGHEVIKCTCIKSGSVVHVHLRMKGGGKNKRRYEEDIPESNKKQKTADHLEIGVYINLLKSKRQPLWFEKVQVPYDLWWTGFVYEVMLAADARKTLKLILDPLERAHDSGICYNGTFPMNHIYYNSKLGIMEIISPDAIISAISPLGLSNDYSIIVEVIDTYFSYVFNDTQCYPMYVQSFLSEIARIVSQPLLCTNSIRRAVLFRPLCTMSSSQRLNIYTAIIIYTKTNQRFKDALSYVTSNWDQDFRTSGRVPSVMADRFGYEHDGTTKPYKNNLFSQTDYARCFISHSNFPGKILDAALYKKWKALLVNLQGFIIRDLTKGPSPEKLPHVPAASAEEVHLFAHMCTASGIDLRELIGLV